MCPGAWIVLQERNLIFAIEPGVILSFIIIKATFYNKVHAYKYQTQ